MLLNNHICKVQSQNFAQMQINYMRSEIDKEGCSLLMSLREMFNANQDMCYRFACEAYMYFVGKRWCDEHDFQLRYEQIATYGVLMSNLVWGYDIAKGEMALYTSSISGIKGMANARVVKGKSRPIAEELNTLASSLYESDRIRKTLHENDWKLVTVRLDPELKNGNTILKPTIPRSPISLQTHIIVPYTAYTKAVELLQDMLQKYILRVTMGDKVRDVTLNQQVLSMIYGDARANQLLSYTSNPYMQKFYVPVVGASKYTPGVTNLDITSIDSVVGKSLADVDMKDVNINYDLAHEYFELVAQAQESDMLRFLCYKFDIPCSAQSPDEDMQDLLIRHSKTMFGADLWKFMKENDDIFMTDNYSSMESKYGNDYELIQKPTDIRAFEKLTREGILKLVIMKRNGSFSTMVCTNNRKLICSVMGDRAMKLESAGVRLRWLKSVLSKAQGIDESDLNKLIARFNLSNILHGSVSEVMRQIEQSLYEVELTKTVVKQADLVLVRNLEAKEDYEYYKNIDLKQVVEIYRLKKGDENE